MSKYRLYTNDPGGKIYLTQDGQYFVDDVDQAGLFEEIEATALIDQSPYLKRELPEDQTTSQADAPKLPGF